MKHTSKIADSSIKIVLMVIGFVIILTLGFMLHVFQMQKLSTQQFDRNNLYSIFVLIFVFGAFYLPLKLLRISETLKKIIDKIQPVKNTDETAYANSAANYATIMSSKKYLAHIWTAYYATFIHSPKNEYADFKDKTRVNADLYFNAEEIVSYTGTKLPSIDLLKIVSGSFVGLGILGTFMGFSQSLSGGIDIQNQVQLDIIVAGLQVAFNTSIFGLFSSIVYNFLIANPILQLLHDRCKVLSDELDNAFYISDEQCMRTLGTIVFETKESITSSTADMTEKVAAAILQGRESFTSELNKTANTLNIISDELRKMPESIRTINSELNETIEIAKKNNQDMLESAINTIEDKIGDLFTNFADRFDDASTTISTSINSVKDLPVQFQNLLTASSEHFKENLSEVMQETENRFNAASEIITTSMNSVKDLPVQFQNLLTDSSHHFKVNLSEVMQETENRFNAASEIIATSMNSVKDLPVQFQNLLTASSEHFKENLSEVMQETENRFNAASEIIATSMNSVKDLPVQFQNLLTDSSDHFKENLSEVMQETENRFNLLLKDTSTGIKTLLSASVKMNIQNTKAMLSETTAIFTAISEEMKASFQSCIDSSTESIETVIDDTKNHLSDCYSDFALSVADAVKNINCISEKLTEIFADYAKIEEVLTNTSDSIKDAEDSLSETVQTVFQDVLEKMKMLVENLSETAISVNRIHTSVDDITKLPEKIHHIFKQFALTTNQLETTYNTTMNKITDLICDCSVIQESSKDEVHLYVSKLDAITKSLENNQENYRNIGTAINDNFAKLFSNIAQLSLTVSEDSSNMGSNV